VAGVPHLADQRDTPGCVKLDDHGDPHLRLHDVIIFVRADHPEVG
jgi:hypothetical protein